MTRRTDLQDTATGEVCPGCEREILIVLGATPDELHLACDCGDALALGSSAPSLAA